MAEGAAVPMPFSQAGDAIILFASKIRAVERVHPAGGGLGDDGRDVTAGEFDGQVARNVKIELLIEAYSRVEEVIVNPEMTGGNRVVNVPDDVVFDYVADG